MIPKKYVILSLLPLALGLLWLLWLIKLRSKPNSEVQAPANTLQSGAGAPKASASLGPTQVYAHNILLRKGPTFRIYLRWVRGQMVRTQSSVDPSFDHPGSFVFLIQKGVIHANLGDIGNFINATMPAKSPLRNITFLGEGDQVRLSGTMRKFLLPLPVEVLSTVSANPDGRIHFHVTRINVLKIPMKGLLGSMNIDVKDIMGSEPIAGVEVSGNDLFFDTTSFLPPPHIRGQLTDVSVARPDLVLIYGNAPNDESQLSQWHNFLRLQGGTVTFGKFTMHDADLTLIDASNDYWFDLDLVNYQAQLRNSYSRMTPESGVEVFMPTFTDAAKPRIQSITLDWLKDRNNSLPADVPVRK